MKVVGFLSNKLTLRGTEVALYDYAHYNETLLNNKSIIITREYEMVKCEQDASLDAYNKFTKRFPVYYYSNQQDIDNIIDYFGITHLYIIKSGYDDGLYPSRELGNHFKTLGIHCVFETRFPHPTPLRYKRVYATISEDNNKRLNTNVPVVPHMIDTPTSNQCGSSTVNTSNLRESLNIPKDAIVFGRYGGMETFDVKCAYEAIVKHILSPSGKNPPSYFLFMNTYRFINENHPRIIYLPGTSDNEYKEKFINTCDAMIHARLQGESFGLACGEFSIRGKPVITYGGSSENQHIRILQEVPESVRIYNNTDELVNIFKNFHVNKFTSPYEKYNPSNVMKIFDEVFLN